MNVAPLLEAQALTSVDSPQQLAREDDGVVPDGDGFSHQSSHCDPGRGEVLGGVQDCPRIGDAQCKTEANRKQEDQTREEADSPKVFFGHDLANCIGLEEERHVDCDGHEKRNDRCYDAGVVGRSRDIGIVERKPIVEVNPRTGVVNRQEKGAEETKCEGQKVEDVDWCSTLVLLREDGGDDEHDEACTELRAVVDSGADHVAVEVVDIHDGCSHWSDTVSHQESNVLGQVIEAAVGGRHLV